MITIYCPHCYAANREGEAVCHRCGASLQTGEEGDFTERLLWALHHPEPTVAPRAAWVLGERRELRAVDPLIELLKAGHMGSQEEAAVALGKIGDPRAVEPLARALLSPHSPVTVRARAAWALGEIGHESARESLTKAMEDRSAGVQEVALQALNRLSGARHAA